MPLHVAYLVNQYPAVSHTFIKREIQALERRGVTVQRIALRGWDAELVDETDRQERERTSYVLREGIGQFASAVLSVALRSPVRLWDAIRLAIKLARRSDRPAPVHLVYVAEACVILRYLARSQARHLHAHFATNPAEIAMLVRTLGGPPYSFTAHGSDIVDSPAQMGFPEKVRLSAFVATVCSFGRSQILSSTTPSGSSMAGWPRPASNWPRRASSTPTGRRCARHLSGSTSCGRLSPTTILVTRLRL